MMNLPTMRFDVRAAGDEAEVRIYDDIGASMWSDGVTAKKFTDDVKSLGKPKTINVRINSAGGSVFEAAAIYNTLAQHNAKVVVHVDGMALSAASVIAMAGDEIRMAENAMMMIHDPWSMAIGGAEDMLREAELLEKIRDTIASTYMARTNKSREEVNQLMSAETWFTAQEAVEAGFADSVTPAKRIAASVDPTRIFNVPQRIADLLAKNKETKMTKDQIAEAIKEDPSIINQYTAQAKLHGEQEGVAAALAEFKGLLDAAGGDTKLAADSFLARQRVDVVKAVVADRQVQVAALAAKDAEIAELRKQAEAAKALADGQPAVAVAPETETPGDKYEGMSAQDRIAAEWDDNAGDCQKTFKNLYAYNAFRVSQMKNSKPKA